MNPQTRLRFRQVHMDFHTSPDIPGVGEHFDPEEFAGMLEEARVDSVTCFARCHHGMLYYESELFPERVHPHLKRRDLLKEQIDACHRRDIRVPIYITVQWDYYTAMAHPEWLSVSENGDILAGPEELTQKPFEPGFYHILCVNSPYRDFLFAHTGEVLEKFDPADGLFFDILFPVSCACRYCREGMLEEGLRPHSDADRMAYSLRSINGFKREMSAFIRSRNPTATIFYNRGHIGTEHREVAAEFSHFELESLPSGLWGYLHFPATIRYARKLGLDCVGVTGKFHTMWGDFHSFKNKAALEFETFRMLALGAKCMIGDQLEPGGKLSAPVYDLIGSVFREIERKEPWCVDAVPVAEIGVVTPEVYAGDGLGELHPALRGAIRMLQEGAHQFDVIDFYSDLSPYKVIILPDTILVDETFAGKLEHYVRSGGSLIATFESGMGLDKNRFLLPGMELSLEAEPTLDIHGNPVRGKQYYRFDYAEYVVPVGEIGRGLPPTEHVMYAKGVELTAGAGSTVLAKTVRPYFDRTYRHFCSHRQTPSSGIEGTDAIVRGGNGRTIYFAHPLFSQYNRNAPRWCKQFVLNAIEMLIGKPLLMHDGPSSVFASVNEQPSDSRTVVHLLHYIPERRSVDIDIIEDVIPLYDVRISLAGEPGVKRVACVPDGPEIAFEERDGRTVFSVPEIRGHQMIAIER
ncbi:alpha-amylase family protein [Cohnella lupini]|uniref:Beta-galactosidase-like protein n=1 Tax=Cohnella lupini TaxID=1294267 RepID=A0A3D9I0V5_9BACL|nr:alpha-amylase family protein [Cohnella lupini]RED55291.1 beta-galactosidase-like protein [Cohnella lupini]